MSRWVALIFWIRFGGPTQWCVGSLRLLVEAGVAARVFGGLSLDFGMRYSVGCQGLSYAFNGAVDKVRACDEDVDG